MCAEKSKLSKEEIDRRLAVHQSLQEMESVKRDMKRSRKHADVPDPAGFSGPIEDLTSAGKSDDQIYTNLKEELGTFLQKLGDYAFSPDQYNRYFANNKIVNLIKIMKSAGMELESRYVLDIFKDRVKQKNGGKMPTIKEKKGMFSKIVERQLKPEEIAFKFEIEDNAPADPNNPTPLGATGTKNGIMNHLITVLLQNEDIEDPFKRAPRKIVGRFLQVAKLLNINAGDPNEKCFVATLLTPDGAQPKSASDKEGIVKFTKIVQKGNKWLDEKLNATKKEAAAQNQEVAAKS